MPAQAFSSPLRLFLNAIILLGSIGSGAAHADFIVYTLPGTKLPIVIEGKVRSQSRTMVDFTYPGFSPVGISRENLTVIKAASQAEEFKKLFNQATRTKSVDDYLEAAEFALKGSRIKEFYECCSAAYKIDPNHPVLKRLIEVRRRIKKPVKNFDEVEARLREVTSQSSMQIAKSDHYVMLHDIPSQGSKNPRVERRLKLLEQVYEAFLLKFAFVGVVLDPPDEPLMVLLFGQEKDYLRYSTRLDPSLASSAGFWSPKDNVAVFFDAGTTEEMKRVGLLIDDLRKARARARGTASSKEISQLMNTFDLLVKIAKSEAEFEVVSHEATHQLAGNTGLMPKERLGLAWSHEGLASYFETPAGAGWGGVGSINPKRLRGYRTIASDPSLGRLQVLVSDYLFDESDDPQTAVDAYGSAWALTHFLMNKYPIKLVEYYRKCGELSDRSATNVTRKQAIDVFEEVFGNMEKLEDEFFQYMAGQKSMLERMLDAAEDEMGFND